MVKRKIENTSYLNNMSFMEKDNLTTFLCGNEQMRAVLCHGSQMINEMRANHQLQIAETLILGQNYLAASLLSANLKEGDGIKIQINCSGPLGGLNAEADYRHYVRGYLLNNPIEVIEPGSMSMSDFFGAGVLSITRINHLTNKPFTGQIEIQYGNTAADLAYYFTVSEQVATSFNLNISFDDSGNVKGAGGLLIQTLPGADESRLIQAEKIINNLPSMGEWFSTGGTADDYIMNNLTDLNPRILNVEKTEFHCDCSRERIKVHISSLADEDKDDIMNKNDFPIKTLCHNCGTSYIFSREESLELIKKQKNMQ